MVNRRIIDQTEALSLSGDDYLVADNTNLGTRKIQFTRLLSGATPLPPDYITGFEITKTGNTTILISGGYARSSDNLQNMRLSTSLIKDISATFDLGNNAGCMPSGLTLQASAKYYVFLIAKSSGETDIIIDTDINCSNGLSDSVVIANNFNKYVCIGSITTDINSQVFIINSYIENISSNTKTTIVNWGIPDYTTKTSITLPYTATESCLYSFEWATSARGTIFINGIEVCHKIGSANDDNYGTQQFLMIGTGDVITTTGNAPQNNYIYKLKGNN